MTSYEGGFRDRLIEESVYQNMISGLTYLGWFETGRQHAPVMCRSTALYDDEEIVPNLVTMSFERCTRVDMEVGSNATVETFETYFDVYAENNAVGAQIAGDIRAVFEGQIAGFDRIVDVYDWSIATPPIVFTVCVDETDASSNRGHPVTKPAERFWHTILVLIEDERGDG